MQIELIGGATKEELENRIKNVAAAGKLSRYPGNVYEVRETCVDYEKNLKMIERIIKMGHKSIIEHDYLVFALCDVSPIIEQTIIGNRLTSFTIKSRREVDFRTVGFYIPEFRDEKNNIHPNNEMLKNKYKKHMQDLFNKYGDLVDKGIHVEDARFILPYSYHSNIIMGLDARELEKLIIYLLVGKVSVIQECKELGNKLFDICKEHVPYIVKTINKAIEDSNNSDNDYYELIKERQNKIKILEKPSIISYTKDADDIIMRAAIMYNFQCSANEAEEFINKKIQEDDNFKSKLMESILNKTEQRELEQVSYTIQIPISLSILTHLTRHRMHSLLLPDFIPMWNLENYIIPPSMQKIKDEIEAVFEKNTKMYEEFKKEGVNEADLVYFYLGGHMLNVITTMNARTLAWIARLRCCNKAQWQIRNIFTEIVNNVRNITPLFGQHIGPTCETKRVCYEGKECCGKINALLEKDKKEKETKD